MKSYTFAALLTCIPRQVTGKGIDEQINTIVSPVAEIITSIVFYPVPLFGTEASVIVLWLIASTVFFTCYFRFINITGIPHAIKLVSGAYSKTSDRGEVSHFQALTAAVSGTVGIGNIAGVAISVTLGGPGVIFWIVLAGLLGMTTKFVECSLGVMYRVHHDDGSVSGGPMHYLERGLADLRYPGLGKALGVFYAGSIVIGCIGIGNMFQSNQALSQFIEVTGATNSFFHGKGWLFGACLAVIVGLVIVGGIKSIAKTTEKLVPFMTILYVGAAVTVLWINYQALPATCALILQEAFSPEGVAGGFIGIMILGFRRAVFSNEAGLGSASIAHAAVRTEKPMTEGYVALLEPFIDTVIICTLTGLVIVTTVYDPGMLEKGVAGIEITSAAFASVLPGSPVLISVAAILFAISTMIAWSYYGLKAWTYLAGDSIPMQTVFKIGYCSFIIVGCSVQLDAIINLSEALIFIIAFPNIVGLYLLAPRVKKELAHYRKTL